MVPRSCTGLLLQQPIRHSRPRRDSILQMALTTPVLRGIGLWGRRWLRGAGGGAGGHHRPHVLCVSSGFGLERQDLTFHQLGVVQLLTDVEEDFSI